MDGTFNSHLVFWLHNLMSSIKALEKSFRLISLVHTVLQAQKLNNLQGADEHTKREPLPPHHEQNQSWTGKLMLIYINL